MVELKIDVPSDFYKGETRSFEGVSHYVTPEIKKVWAVQLDLIKEFERVCDKYGLRYSAYAGTMLGAIRHKGFIPWDDDVDLIMPRKDYDILLSHSDEFKHPYFLQTPYTDKGYFDYVAKFRRSDTTGIVKTDIYQDTNNGIFIDIFVLDDIPIKKVEKLKKMILTKLYAQSIYFKFDREKRKSIRKKKVVLSSISISKYRKLEDLCRKKTRLPPNEMGAYQFGILFNRTIHFKSDFDDIVEVPFEFSSIRICKNYKPTLIRQYGKNYMTPIKGASLHQGVIFSADTPYTEFLKQLRKQN